eukprot:COSAG04_NODE_3288_length_2970_cov_33.737374_2_plen_85_part_00
MHEILFHSLTWRGLFDGTPVHKLLQQSFDDSDVGPQCRLAPLLRVQTALHGHRFLCRGFARPLMRLRRRLAMRHGAPYQWRHAE